MIVVLLIVGEDVPGVSPDALRLSLGDCLGVLPVLIRTDLLGESSSSLKRNHSNYECIIS